MKKLSYFVALAAVLVGISSCEKQDPTALETSDLKGTVLAGHVYYQEIEDDGTKGDLVNFSGKADVIIEVTEKTAGGEATGNVILVTEALKGGKFQANIPVAVGKIAECKVTCMFNQTNYDANLLEQDFESVMITYKAETKTAITYGETVYCALIGEPKGALNNEGHFITLP